MSCRRESGYTLIEILVVTTVIAIIMASVLPAFLIAKKQANESAAIASLRSVSRAQLQHRTRYGSFTDIAGLEAAKGFMNIVSDEGLAKVKSLLVALSEANGEADRSGWRFVSTKVCGPVRWTVTRWPPGSTGSLSTLSRSAVV